MDPIVERIIRHAQAEWATVIHAPVLFAVAVVIVGITLWFGIRAHFRERMDTLSATIDHKQSLLDEYKDKLQGATPVEVQQKIANLESTVASLDKLVNRPQRRLTEDQAKCLRAEITQVMANYMIDAALAGNYGSAHFMLNINSTPDKESTRFCRSLTNSLSELGIQCGMNMLGIHDEGENGIIFYCQDLTAQHWFAKVADAFEKSGLSIERRVDLYNPWQTYIFIAPEEG